MLLNNLDHLSWDAQVSSTVCVKCLPRQYSISSSLLAYPEEAHVTIGVVRYEVDGRKRRRCLFDILLLNN